MSLLSQREKNIVRSIDAMFQGMDDDVLKEIILATALQKSEQEKEKIIEAIRQKNEKDLQDIEEKFQIHIDSSEPLKMLELFKTYVEQNPELVAEVERDVALLERDVALLEKQAEEEERIKLQIQDSESS
jgi:hypothetical protein